MHRYGLWFFGILVALVENGGSDLCQKHVALDRAFYDPMRLAHFQSGMDIHPFFVFLGSAAALFGSWLEHAGPRKAGVLAASCWAGGLWLSAWGIYLHQLWLMWLGSGVIGGIGLGLGYILVFPVHPRHFMSEAELARERALAHERLEVSQKPADEEGIRPPPFIGPTP